ncbi:GIDE domain-containing protein [Natronosalvus vescus]|uniref:GIDE domain-containing protein n=1 Tax=Natronosalvus vescus TaxID=2953881 RepID=UPI0020918C34|nr:GIDE domain-containing protein [Natronosalvus vescus]
MPTLVVTLLALGLIAAIAFLGYGLWELRLAYRIYGTDPDTVLDATNGGSVELAGTVAVENDVIESPFTHTDCVAFSYTIEEKRSRSSKHGSNTKWVDIDSATYWVPFRLEDRSGSVLVNPDGARFRLTRDSSIRVKGGDEPPEPIARFIASDEDISDENTSISLGPLELSTGRTRRYRERRLDVGASVHVLGTARHDTTVSRDVGHVNAVIEASEPARDGWPAWLRHRLFGPPFVIFDVSESRAARRVAFTGLLSTFVGLVALALVLAVPFPLGILGGVH